MEPGTRRRVTCRKPRREIQSMTKATDNHCTYAHSGGVGFWFSHFAQLTAAWTGHPLAFLLAVIVIFVWLVSGPVFHYCDTWQLVINTSTTIVAFLMVFLIQNTQNRDMLTVQFKLSELVLGLKGAKNKFASIEDLGDEELHALHSDCRARAEITEHHLRQRNSAARGNGAHKSRPPAASRVQGRHRALRHAAKS
jgi:low affinity Fe/Cu permease